MQLKQGVQVLLSLQLALGSGTREHKAMSGKVKGLAWQSLVRGFRGLANLKEKATWTPPNALPKKGPKGPNLAHPLLPAVPR